MQGTLSISSALKACMQAHAFCAVHIAGPIDAALQTWLWQSYLRSLDVQPAGRDSILKEVCLVRTQRTKHHSHPLAKYISVGVCEESDGGIVRGGEHGPRYFPKRL